MAIVALMVGGMSIGIGGLSSARLRESATLVAGAIKAGYNHANARSRTTRLVFDFEARSITVEDSAGRMFLERGSRTGGAAAATDAEAAAVAASEEILKGPRPPRPSFTPVRDLLGFEYDSGRGIAQKKLSDGIYFGALEVAHEDEAVFEERVYLYFFPGGQAERAHLRVQKGTEPDDDDDILTVTIAPLTGKVQILNGSVDMPRPTTDEEASERQDTGF